MEQHNVTDVMHNLETGDTFTINGFTQTFTVTNTMFDGEIIVMEGPQGGEKSLVENINSGNVAIQNSRSKTVGTLTEINMVQVV